MSDTKEGCRLTKRQQAAQMVKFTLFSISAGVVQAASFTLLNEITSLPYLPSYLTALLLSVLWNFTLNRHFTFQSAGNIPKAMLLVLLYYAVFTPASAAWGELLINAGWNEYFVLGITMIVNFVTEFLYQRFIVFRRTINTNSRARQKEEARQAPL